MTQTLPALLSTEAQAETRPVAVGRQGFALVAAQLMGQDGARRGLRAGPQAVEAAQGAYRQREFSGAGDRRLVAGYFASAAI
jgi:hypothetical protein